MNFSTAPLQQRNSLSLWTIYIVLFVGVRFSSSELMLNLLIYVSERRIWPRNSKIFKVSENEMFPSALKSHKIFIVYFLLIFPVLTLLSMAFGSTRENCAHIIMRLRQRLCPVSAGSQMHTNGLWKYTDMQRGSARRWGVSSLACQRLGHPAFQTASCCIVRRSSSAQKLLIHQDVTAPLRGNQSSSANIHL